MELCFGFTDMDSFERVFFFFRVEIVYFGCLGKFIGGIFVGNSLSRRIEGYVDGGRRR